MTNQPPSSIITEPLVRQTGFYREANLQDLIERVVSDLCEPCPKQTAVPIHGLLDRYEKSLAGFHQLFKQGTREELTLSSASEWVLDNYNIIRQAILQIREDLPQSYNDSLPKLDRTTFKGFPRIYLVTRSILTAEQLQIDLGHLEMFIQQMQEHIPLTMGELWAVPIFLRFTLIEALVFALGHITRSGKQDPTTPVFDLKISSDEVVATAITGLRAISTLDWKNFFETVSQVEQILRADPAGVYAEMEFTSRDLYRKAVEELASASRLSQIDIATAAKKISEEHANQYRDTGLPKLEVDRRGEHVGYYLIDRGRAELEARIGYQPAAFKRLHRWLRSHPLILYLSSIVLSVFFLLAFPTFYLVALQASAWQFIVAWLVLLIPAITFGTGVVNWLATLFYPPSRLPKLDLKGEIPPEWSTLVTIPSLITSQDEITSLARQLEQHYLRNPQRGLYFALVSDFADADEEILPEDNRLVEQAIRSIEQLNRQYQNADGSRPFFLFHRRRMWNPKEGKWMGWERKRGKLHELNRLLRGDTKLSFSNISGELGQLKDVRYILTLDADTILPLGAASRLIGTMAHPLNRPIFKTGSSQILTGYTILQPRVEINPNRSNRSWFTRIYAGDVGLDLYSLAASDVYQDLFGEGTYVGKGIYDIDGFERSMDGLIPENALLSHDLFEGLLGRAGLVTDITLVEDYPVNYFVYANRQHRWMRGDWQLLPWLLNLAKKPVHLSILDRWKIVDNLRRSLVAPALMLLFLESWLILPGWRPVWMLLGLMSIFFPVLTNLFLAILQLISRKPARDLMRPVKLDFLRWAVAVAFLPIEAFNALDAITVTLYRLIVSRRNFLQWVANANVELLLQQSNQRFIVLREIRLAFLFLLEIIAILLIFNPSAIWEASPLLIIWLISPQVAFWINRPIHKEKDVLSDSQIQQLRSYARRTWTFFETFVGPEDHWLPPDHYQESPVGVVAHRTSPTNIGLLFTSTLAAYELGYIDKFGLVSRLSATFDTLESLERYHGHFMNWIDTLTLEPLNPRYISTVDSGNLAACLIVIAEALHDLRDEVHVFRWKHWQGYLDSLAMFDTTLAGLKPSSEDLPTHLLRSLIKDIQERVKAVRRHREKWYQLFLQVSGPTWEEMMRLLTELVTSVEGSVDMMLLKHISQVAQQVDRQIKGMKRTIQEFVPWIPLLENPPALLMEPEYLDLFNSLRRTLPYSPVFSKISQHAEEGKQIIQELREILGQPEDQSREAEALEWLENLVGELQCAVSNNRAMLDTYDRIASTALRYVDEMEFRFLYNPERRVFHIGYNLDAARLDENCYDLLASEARITSLIAIAKNEVPQEHWLHLNRPVTLVDGYHVLLSWSATMFEYLMPALFFRADEGTLLKESLEGAIWSQRNYGRKQGLPWGVSESGFYQFDANQNYQYRAFGVPGLGFKRGLGDDMVITPYASFLAVSFQPLAVLRNADELASYGMLGLYGFYEAIDFSENHRPDGKAYGIVRSYMTHHHGMTMLALLNYTHNNFIVRLMHANAQIKSVELLLQEQIPYTAPLQNPESEDVKGTQRLVPPPVEIQPWVVPVHTTIPQVHSLSNGVFTSLVSNSGSGFLRWHDTELTRWQSDSVLDQSGIWIYIKDLESKAKNAKVWSVTIQPCPEALNGNLVTFHSHMVVFQGSREGITATLEVAVSVDDPVEIRRLHLANATNRTRKLRLASYGEVILTSQATDARHPAFNKLFIQSEYLPDSNLMVFRRRSRSNKEIPIFLGHMLVTPDEMEAKTFFETDRAKFLGRWNNVHNPAYLSLRDKLSGSSGATLDPIFSLGQDISLQPHESVSLIWLTFAAASREEILILANRYSSARFIDQAYHQAHITSVNRLRKREISGEMLGQYLQILSALFYPHPAHRTDVETIAANRLGQTGLWPFGISGDYPILLVKVSDPKELDLVRECLRAHRFFRDRGSKIDLVILNKQLTDYGAEMHRLLHRLITRANSEGLLNQRGGIFILHADQMKRTERVLMNTVARIILDAEKGSLKDQLPGYTIPVHHLPAFSAIRGKSVEEQKPPAWAEGEELLFFNGFGGFSPDGREYVIHLSGKNKPPMPWSNIIGYADFGFLVTESGSSSTWCMNSGENRLTPWWNDPISDPSGEIMYLRDEETGEVWTPTPQPAGGRSPFRVCHGAGYTTFEHHSHELDQQLKLTADPLDPVKIITLRVANTSNRPRRVTVTQYVEWVLGTQRSISSQYMIPEYDAANEVLLVTNPYNPEFNQRVAFLAANKKIHGMTADRLEFFGRNGSLQTPIALKRIGLEGRITPGDHPCAALQLHIDLPPGSEEQVYFFLGEAEDRKQALALVQKYHSAEAVAQSWQAVHEFWDERLGTIQVKTPDKAMDLLLNRWMLYQTLSCRIWGRTAFYQSSGAYGFRDQLQDVMAALWVEPKIAREQILDAARHQFEEGDVLHWWHPPAGRGVRTRISDDLLWLPYVVAEYVQFTGDLDILQEKQPFRQARALYEDEEERYGLFPLTRQKYSILEHCRRAVERASAYGPHRLPLMGYGDWNDGMNRVGMGGQGESVWLAWFLFETLGRFAHLCELAGQVKEAEKYHQQAQELKAAVEASAWDGQWYLRAFYDSGAPLGSSKNLECQIDSIAQSWAVISGGGDPQRARAGLEAVLEHLLRQDDRLLLLFTPPFDKSPRDPGYIKGYVPGIRENGGQYTHASTWVAWAFALLGEGDRAGELFSLLNPIYQAEDAQAVDVYKVEPYVVAADIYSVPPHVRRGGWTWYTGSSGWLYRLGVEMLLGLKRVDDHLLLNPVIPQKWEGFEIAYQNRLACYHIEVRNPNHVEQGVKAVIVDGIEQKETRIPWNEDGKSHRVEVVMG